MPTTARWSLSLPVRHPSVARSSASCSADGQRVPQDIPKWHCRTRDREKEEEELPCPRGLGALGPALSQPPCVVQGVVSGRDRSSEAWGGAVGQGRNGDAGRSKGRN